MNGSLRIALLSQEFPPHTSWGGIGVYNGELARTYRRLGHDVAVVSRAAAGAPRQHTHDGVPVHRVGRLIGRKRMTGRTIDRLLHARAVERCVRQLEAEQRFDVIETTEAALEPWKLVADPRFARRLVIQCNGSNAFGEVPGGVLRPLHRLDWRWSFGYEQKILTRVRFVIATSEATRGVLLRQGVPADKVHLIHQGIDTERFSPVGRVPANGTLRVGFVGRLESRKGIDFIWRVIERFTADRTVEFHLKGAVHPASQRLVARRLEEFAGLVTLHPPGSHSDMPAFYRSLDVLLQPSRFENFGLAYVEAMASRVVVLAGRNGGGSEIVEDGRTGYLVDPDGPVDGVVDRIRLLAARPDAADSLTAAARQAVVARFSLADCARKKIELYRQVSRAAASQEMS